MRDKPSRPTNYFSYRDIAEATELTPETVRTLIIRLTKDGWLTRQNNRTFYTPQGKPENQYRWTLTKVTFELDAAYKKEDEAEAERQTYIDDSDNPDYIVVDGKVWRVGRKPGLAKQKQRCYQRRMEGYHDRPGSRC